MEFNIPLFLRERDRDASKGAPLGSHRVAGDPRRRRSGGRVCIHYFTGGGSGPEELPCARLLRWAHRLCGHAEARLAHQGAPDSGSVPPSTVHVGDGLSLHDARQGHRRYAGPSSGLRHSHSNHDHPGALNANGGISHYIVEYYAPAPVVSHAALRGQGAIGRRVGGRLLPAERLALRAALACSRTPHQGRQSSRHIRKTRSVGFLGAYSLS